MAFDGMQAVTRSVVGSLRGRQHGSTTTDGQAITQPNPPGKRIETKAQATSIRSVLRLARPKLAGWEKTEEGRMMQVWETPDLTDQQTQIVEYHSRPAHPDTIQGHILRLAMHKHLKGDQSQKAFLLADYSKRLSGSTELQIFDAVEYFIEEDDGDFFPTFGKIKKYIWG